MGTLTLCRKPLKSAGLECHTSNKLSKFLKFPKVCVCVCVCVLVAQLYLTLCDPMDCGLPGSSVHGILLARILEWVAILFSRGSSQPRD